MFKKFLLAGSLVWVPIIATLWIVNILVGLFDKLFTIIPLKYQPSTLLGMHIPGISILFAVIVVLLTGVLVTNILGNKIMQWSDEFFRHIPFVGSLYSTIKQVTQTLMASDGKSFRQVVLIEYPREGLWSIAFLTSDVSDEINQAADSELVSVFIPTTPNPTSGFLILAPKDKVKNLEMSVDEAFKIVVSLGTLHSHTALPHKNNAQH